MLLPSGYFNFISAELESCASVVKIAAVLTRHSGADR
jgi:hypothetical protein